MKISCKNEYGMNVVSVEEADVYSPETEKERKITLETLRTEACRISLKAERERNTQHREELTEELNAANELIGIYTTGNEFRVIPIYRDILTSALRHEKKHRKAAMRALRNINDVMPFSKIEIGSSFDISGLFDFDRI